MPLAKIMSAPNGATKTKQDHKALPISIEEVIESAKQCFVAGAGALHAHVRDEEGQHILDAGLYKELLGEAFVQIPQMQVQITTEAVGRYRPYEQMQLVKDVSPKMVSCAWRELSSEGVGPALEFYQWALEADIAVQHILYDDNDVVEFLQAMDQCELIRPQTQVLFVLGRYAEAKQAQTQDLDPFLKAMGNHRLDWALCAFGKAETICLSYGAKKGGKIRVGFENNLHNQDGNLAKNNAERVAEIKKISGN